MSFAPCPSTPLTYVRDTRNHHHHHHHHRDVDVVVGVAASRTAALACATARRDGLTDEAVLEEAGEMTGDRIIV